MQIILMFLMMWVVLIVSSMYYLANLAYKKLRTVTPAKYFIGRK